LLVILQRRNLHQGAFRVGAMHRLAVVSQRLLRKPFRVTLVTGDFSPVAGSLLLLAGDFSPFAGALGQMLSMGGGSCRAG